MDEVRREKIRNSLNHVHQWPSKYMFKFIVGSDSENLIELKKLFPETAEFSQKSSSTGKYISLTVKMIVMNAEEVFERHEAASKIEGVISL